MKSFEVSCPGKFILFGEHAVVYGTKAIAASLNLRTSIKACDSTDFCIVLSDFGYHKTFSLSDLEHLFKASDLETAIKAFLGDTNDSPIVQASIFAILYKYLTIFNSPFPMRIVVKSELPPGGGVGSSAAFSVCLSATFLYASGQISNDLTENDLKAISEHALACEKLFHSKPSGIDNSICTYGGCLSFKSGTIEHLKTPPLKILLINSGVSRSTKDLVDKVRKNYDQFTSLYQNIFDGIASVVERADAELAVGNITVLKELTRVNQGLLYAIDVSHETLDKIVRIAKLNGITAKLTGAGGGGFAIALVDGVPVDVLQSCMKQLQENGFQSWLADACSPGVKIVLE